MTTLDKAFIKAFQKTDAPSTASCPAPDVELEELEALAVETHREPSCEENTSLPEDTPTPLETDESFRAMLQVDGFGWPSVCNDMPPVAEAQLDCLAARLVGDDVPGRTVVGLAGCDAGVGCTTVLLAAARRLTRRGLNVAIMDANLGNPRLASRLGLLPEVGWEAIATGQLPVAEVLIESIEDRLTLLPLCDPKPLYDGNDAEAFSSRMHRVVETLRRHYDLVLVDVGVPGDVGISGVSNTAEGWSADWLDAAVLVDDVRDASPTALAQARTCLETAGVTVVGVAENYVPLEEASARRDVA